MPLQHYRQALTPGFRLFWYEIFSVLGQGGFGVTYLARDTNLDRNVAIKEYLPVDIARRGGLGEVEPRSAGDTELYQRGMARFLVEAKTLNRFDHPNIVRVYSVFEANSTAYMVMRYEDGEALSALLERVKTLPQEQLLAIAGPLLDGLAQIHAAGFIHRDVQPANIYLRRDGSPVLLDFGAAREATSGARTMTILVAPGYAPIEQYYAHGEQGPWTDIYGLAASLYRAITGNPPIDAIERSRGILGSTRDMLVPALVAGHGRYGGAFLAAVDHALMFNEHERPSSAIAWAEELRGQATVPLLGSSSRDLPPAAVVEVNVADIPASAPAQTAARAAVRRVVWPVTLLLVLTVLALAMVRYGAVDISALQQVTDVGRSMPLATTVPAPPPVDDRQGERLKAADERIAALESEVRDLSEKLRATAAGPSEASPGAEKGGASPDAPVINAVSSKPGKPPGAVEPRTSSPLPSAPVPATRPTTVPASPAAKPRDLLEDTRAAQTLSKKPDAPTPDMTPVAPPQAAVRPPPVSHAPPAAPSEAVRAGELLARGDYSAARSLLQSAAMANDGDAQLLLAQLLEDARAGPVDRGAALEWRLRSARAGRRDAQVAVARAYRPGPGSVMNEPFLAYTWFVVAEQNGAVDVAQEREQASRLLQPEQLPQALALANALHSMATPH